MDEITYDDKKASLLLSNGTTIEADAVLITVPLGVLQNNGVKFNPPLPENKVNAMANDLEMGVLDKVAISFTEPFWD